MNQGRRPLRARSVRTAAAGGALLLAFALGGSAALAARSPRCVPARLNVSATLGGSGVTAAPLPGSYDASADTQISLLGAPASAFGAIAVSGSQTGRHPGRLLGYSQGDGASFVPARPFRPGERVSVRGAVRIAGTTRRFGYSFTVAHAVALPYVPEPRPGANPAETQHYVSAPQLQPPAIITTARSPAAEPGYLFASPYGGPGPNGPMIFDDAGNLVWFDPLPANIEATNLQVQSLDGRPVLTWWQGRVPKQGFGQGEEVILDSSYRLIGRVHAGNGYSADLHDFHITARDTALLTVFQPLYCDLSALPAGRSDGAVTDAVFEAVDLRTGLVRREWHSLDHVPLGDSYNSPAGAGASWPFDYFHLNSVQQLANGRTLLSARNTWAIYELDSGSGRVLRTIGGRHSSVKLAAGAATAFQHDATLLDDGAIAIFDNGALPKVHTQSRALLLELDAATDTGAVRAQYLHPTPLLSGSQGNVQALANGDVFVGWGAAPYFSEFGPAGQLLFDAHMPGSYQSYRTYRFAWTGAPAAPPAIAAGAGAGGYVVYASWNGDTRTVAWRLYGGPSPSALPLLATVPRTGFETAIATPGREPYFAVQAVDGSGRAIGTSLAVSG